MKWATAISRKAVFEDALIECVAGVREALGSGSVTLAVAFVTPHFAEFYERLHKVLREALGPETLLGCSAGGVIGGGEEVERLPAVTLTTARLPEVVVRTFHLDGGALPDLDGPPDSWERLVGAERSQEPQFVLLADPFTSRPEALVTTSAGTSRPSSGTRSRGWPAGRPSRARPRSGVSPAAVPLRV